MRVIDVDSHYFEPPNWQFAVDYYRLRVEDEIGDINVTLACFDPANTEHLFCDRIRRTAADLYNIIEVDDRTINRGVLRTYGVDTQVQYATDLPEWMGIGSNGRRLNLLLGGVKLAIANIGKNRV